MERGLRRVFLVVRNEEEIAVNLFPELFQQLISGVVADVDVVLEEKLFFLHFFASGQRRLRKAKDFFQVFELLVFFSFLF